MTNCICRELQHFGTIYIAVVTEYLTQDMRLVPSWWVRSGCQINGSTREVKSSDDPAVLIWTNSIDYSGLRKSYKNSREHVYVNCFVVSQVFVILVFWTVPCFFFFKYWQLTLSLKEKISKSSNVSFITCNLYKTNLKTCRFLKKGEVETLEFSTCLIHDIYMYVINVNRDVRLWSCFHLSEEMKRKLTMEYLYERMKTTDLPFNKLLVFFFKCIMGWLILF